MGKLKISSDFHKAAMFNFPLPPDTFKLSIELVGEAIKLTCDDDKEIVLNTKHFNRYRTLERILLACNLLQDALILQKKKII